MVCENCKEKPANITVTQVQNGQKMEHHYCETCASKFHPFQFEVQDEPISLQQFITNWFGTPLKSSVRDEKQPSASQVVCPHCHLSYLQFLKKGKVGCAGCYIAFRSYLPSILEKLQAGTTHISSTETRVDSVQKVEQQIHMLREQLKLAIEQGRFEDAAKLRDEIKLLERNNTAGGVDSP